ncbi:formate dehydrogenase iron-sulfur subunit [Streptosporangium subroseum]|uniref:Formate dehydrogenase iron-sulfur subunit n=1 Tax=Streptosporangium subroseum TaxID=106412 RepID=A0A239E7X9_9ACTN|nr:formate dehydrogenase iron-sulfur subunit [Streptosporangium subroseum]
MAERMGFFTDTSICIGCKACEVACKEWNDVPDDGFVFRATSYDNTGSLGANTWRHVAFIEQQRPVRQAGGQSQGQAGSQDQSQEQAGHGQVSSQGQGQDQSQEQAGQGQAGQVSGQGQGQADGPGPDSIERWLMSSDVCKHCTHAACLDVCPTGALFRTEFGTVVVQEDICNGCGYCVPACPYGVIDRRERDGRAWKCTMCYDRQLGGLEPACAKACPTDSIQFGPLDELRLRAEERVERLHEEGRPEARLYGASPDDGVGGDGAFFLLLDEPEVYGLPPDPVVTTRDLPTMWRWAGGAAVSLVGAMAVSFVAESIVEKVTGRAGARGSHRGSVREALRTIDRGQSGHGAVVREALKMVDRGRTGTRGSHRGWGR